MAETEEAAHLATIRKQWALQKRSSKTRHFKVVRGKLVSRKVKPPKKFDVVIAEKKQALQESALQIFEIGQLMADGTIYLGRYSPKDHDNNSLGKTFNVFAAPEDLTDASGKKEIYTYPDTVTRMAELKSWHGYDGTNYATDAEIYQALKDGNYKGGWIIPPRELLTGTAAEGPSGVRQGAIVQPDNLYVCRDKGALKDTFFTALCTIADDPAWYWSSTMHDGPLYMCDIHFTDGFEHFHGKEAFRQSCRPVRLVPVQTP